MRKLVIMTLVCCILMSSVSAFALAENIIIDGTAVTIPEGMGKICEKDDRTFVPVRFLMEHLGCYVNYTEQQQGATITNPATGLSYYMMANSNEIFELSSLSGRAIIMDTNIFINNDEGRMYVPIRYIAQAMGYTVGWDEATQTVTLTSAQ